MDLDVEWRHTDDCHHRNAPCQIFEIPLVGSDVIKQWLELHAERLEWTLQL